MVAAADDKATFFERYRAATENSDGDDDKNDDKNALPKRKLTDQPSGSKLKSGGRSFSDSLPSEWQSSSICTSTPTIVVKETPLLPRRHDTWPSAKSHISEASTAVVEETPIPHTRRILRKSHTAPEGSVVARGEVQVLNTPMGQVTGKRKRKEQSIKLVPEARRIFADLRFFYIPNNDISAVRRAKITKAREYGAHWLTSWDDSATHIIVDQGLERKDVLLGLQSKSIPTNVTIINEAYPSDCIHFRALLDPTQSQYLVKDCHEESSAKIPSSFPTQESDKSLKVKPAKSMWGKGELERLKETPEKSQASTIEQTPAGRAYNKSPILSSQGSYGIDLEEPKNDSPTGLATKRAASLGGKKINEKRASEDGLDEIIKQLQEVEHLPLDDDDDEVQKDDVDEYSSDDAISSPSRSPQKIRKRPARGNEDINQSRFACFHGGTGSSTNPNDRTITVLQEMAEYYGRINDNWRQLSYRKAVSTLRRQEKRIETAEEAVKLPFVGQRLAEKIEEIVTTDRLRHLEAAKGTSDDHLLQKFMNVYGAGPAQAVSWIRQGFRSLEDLEARASLSATQRIGIEHYEDFQTRIPRDEVTALGEIVKSAARQLDPQVKVIIGGSYRRGAADSGDIDCLLTKPGTSSLEDFAIFFNELIFHLRDTKFLVASLNSPPWRSLWHGCCVLPPAEGDDSKQVWRRIDLLIVPDSQLGAALIYFTGNDIFNRSMRLLASKKGMCLNQRGLYKDVMRLQGRVKANRGSLVEGRDEKRIFEALGVPWRPPEERIC